MDRNWLVAAFIVGGFIALESVGETTRSTDLNAFLETDLVAIKEPLLNGDSCDQVYLLTTRQGRKLVLKELDTRRSLSKRKAIVNITAWAGKEGLGPSLVWHDDRYTAFVTKFVDRPPLRRLDINPALLKKIAQVFRKVHGYKEVFPLSYSLKERTINRARELERHLSSEQKTMWPKLILKIKGMKTDALDSVVSHGDIKPQNILGRDAAISLIDWGEVTKTSPYDDLGSFAYHFNLKAEDESFMLKAYLRRDPKLKETELLHAHRFLAALNHMLWQARLYCRKYRDILPLIRRRLDLFKGFL